MAANVRDDRLGWRLQLDFGTLRYIVLLFLITRMLLVAVGLAIRVFLPPLQTGYSDLPFLDIWGAWDAAWYVGIANQGYSSSTNEYNQANYAYFPLYPLLMAALKPVTGDAYVAGLIISNVGFIVASVYLYKLARLDYDSDVALHAIKYLFLFPVAFVFSSALTESLYLALTLMCFYYARQRNWLIVIPVSFLLALTKALGALIALPLLYEYLRSSGLTLSTIRKGLVIACAPIFGLILFAGLTYQLTGDILAFIRIQSTWGAQLVNPLLVLIVSMLMSDIKAWLPGWFTAITLVSLVRYSRHIYSPYLLFAMYSILVPLTKTPYFPSMFRYLSVIFPLYFLLGYLATKSRRFDLVATVLLASLQGFLMAAWSLGSDLVM